MSASVHAIRSWLAAALVGLGASGGPGCLSVPEEPQPMCASTSQCDHDHGEVCEEGVCWGNPPPGPFAAVISPPSTRHDLVPLEISSAPIPDYGWVGDIALEPAVRMTGRVTAFCPPPMTGCEATTLAATFTVSRASQFHGGPAFKTVATVEAGAASFSIPVPRTRQGDEPYTVTIVADSGRETLGGSTSALPLPPLHFQVAMPDSATIKAEVGGLDLPVLSGTLTDSSGRGLAQYRIAALGRWELGAPAVEVSTIDFTDANGAYAVTLSDDLVGPVELVARPTGSTIAPTVHLSNIDPSKSSSRSVMVPATLGSPRTVTVQVTGLDRSGMITQVSGAVVSVAGVSTKTLTSFTVTDDEVTDDKGIATLQLLDGADLAGTYRMSITPPAASSLGVLFDQKLTIATGQTITTRLGARVALRGKILDSGGDALSNVAITARPSLRFLWTLDAGPQSFVAAVPAATAVTADTGEFVVWVDGNVAQVWGHYDLLIEPPPGVRAPTYLKNEIEIPRDNTLDAVSLGEITLPEAANVHGRITAPNGDPVEKAELRLYLASTAVSLCTEVAHAPLSCPIPAQLQARGTSDTDGIVRVTLPR
ncbi:MAG TPA: hypothetical protein VGD80_36270 [Kofleriaceae bacterium]